MTFRVKLKLVGHTRYGVLYGLLVDGKHECESMTLLQRQADALIDQSGWHQRNCEHMSRNEALRRFQIKLVPDGERFTKKTLERYLAFLLIGEEHSVALAAQ